MKIRTKLILLYLLGASLTSLTAAFVIRSFRIIENDFQIVMEDSVKKIESLRQLERSALRVIASTSEFSSIVAERSEAENHLTQIKSTETSAIIAKNDNDEEMELVNDGLMKYYIHLSEYASLVKNSADDQENYLEEIQSNGNKLAEISSVIINLKKQKISGERILKKKEEFEKAEEDLLASIEKALKHQTQVLAEKQNNVQSTIWQSTDNTLLITAISFAFALLGGALFSTAITNSLTKLREATRQIGNGVLDAKIEIKSRDEIADLADDFQKMAFQLRDARDELLKSKSFTENIIESMADMLITVDDNGIIVGVNHAFHGQMGWQENEILGKPIKTLTKTESFLTNEEYENLKNNRKLVEIEKDFVRRNGNKFRCSVSASILKDFDTAAVIVAKDISQRIEDERRLKANSKQLEQSNRELQDFAYVASHDLQEPLRKVQAFGDRLSRKYSEILGEEGKDYVRRMRDASNRMQTLITDLLTFSRVTSKAQPFQPINLKEIAEEVVSDLEVRIEETHGKVVIGDLPEIDADPLQMRQLMQNLIGNALKFHRSNESPLIKIYSPQTTLNSTASFIFNGETLKTQSSSETVCQIAIQDNGIGFDEKYLDRIFTVFQRLHGQSEFEGSGVGLAVCRKIVERHNGNITAKSKEGVGSTFIITLPIIQNYKEINHNETRL
ncbi:MAG TPA: ATP-binding protein [Pyrinomonadaceae bacterium]|nr:ATP-binding protein [Pyrinomonadaceae bacterium]